ncbi:MAG: ketoacyl-ACP synthase III [Gammaproteobacteria bacterium]|nr:MAG: ketoacyl-ACP synthase III [Gammaproteobacteria bacterium]
MKPMYSRIAGTGRYLPERVLTNQDLEQMIDTTDEWIRSRTGIERRHIAADDQTTADLAELAARQALDAAGLEPEAIDFIVVGTTSPDTVFPNVGCLVQERLGIRGCPAFGIEAACSGFIYALSIADRFVATGGAQHALVIGAETLSRMVDYKDRATCVIFGDGAGAVVLEPSAEQGIISCHLRADGHYKDLLYHPYGVSKQRKPEDTEGPYIHMRGNEVFKVAVRSLESIVDETLAANDLEKGSIDWLIPHQANLRIIQLTAKRLGMPMDKVVLTLKDQGNTSAASVPMALDVAVRDGRVQRGDMVLLEAFGGGFTWGSALVRY